MQQPFFVPARPDVTVHPIEVSHPDLGALFDEDGPHAPMGFAVLDERALGRAFADDVHSPKLAIVQTREGLAIQSKATSRAFLDAALSALRADSMVGLVRSYEDGLEPNDTPAKRVERVDFAPFDPSAESLVGLRRSLPPAVRVASLTPDLLERCEWRHVVTEAAGDVDAFLETGLGLCLMAGDEILCEAYAPFIGRRTAEVGVVTAEGHRGRGLAAIAVAFLAESLSHRDLRLYWSCDAENTASIRIAEKLGLDNRRPYEMLLYRPLPAAGVAG